VREELQWMTLQQLDDLRKQQLEPMPTLPPQAVEPLPDHIWDMLLLAARSSRYG